MMLVLLSFGGMSSIIKCFILLVEKNVYSVCQPFKVLD
jgi:hypothetical protein